MQTSGDQRREIAKSYIVRHGCERSDTHRSTRRR